MINVAQHPDTGGPVRSQSATPTITRAVTVAAGVFAPGIWAS